MIKSKNRSTFICNLWREEDSAYLGIFRIGWGLIMALEIFLFISNDFRKTKKFFFSNPYNFYPKYYLFEWVEIVSYENMQLIMYFLLIASLCITSGFYYRQFSIIYFIGICYIFLMDIVHYLNHIYLVCVISLLMIFLPCNCVYSIDAYRKPQKYARSTQPVYSVLFSMLLLRS